MIWRIIGIFLNPFVALAWPLLRWIGRGIDRLLGPAVGWYFAGLLFLLTGASLALGLYAAAPPIGGLIGVIDPVVVQTVDGKVVETEMLDDGKLTVKQRIVVTFDDAGSVRTFEERVTQPSTRAHAIGDTVTVYQQAGTLPTTKNPNDPIGDAVFAAFSLVFPLVFFLLSLKFLRYRGRMYGARPRRLQAAAAVPEMEVVLRGRDRVMTTAERLKADEARARQTGVDRSRR